MKLRQFLQLLFDKQTDRYPEIRKSFLQCWSTNEVLDILAITNYHCSQNELKQYIKYTYCDKGIQVSSLGSPSWSFPRECIVNNIYHDKNSSTEKIMNHVEKWFTTVSSAQGPLTSIFEIRSSNSEFSMFINIAARLSGRNNIGGSILTEVSFKSKINPRYQLSDSLISQDITQMITPLLYDKVKIAVFHVKQLVEVLSMPMDEFKYWFISNLRYEYSDRDIDSFSDI